MRDTPPDLPLNRLLHDNMGTVVNFVFSYWPIIRLMKEKFVGYPKRFEEFALIVPGRNAIRACLEIAVIIRLIDDRSEIVKYLKQVNPATLGCFGVVHRTDGAQEALTLRALTDKIIHAERRYWDLDVEQAPKLICTAADDQQQKHGWVKAEVDIINLAFFCDGLFTERI
jgi:hypothetical protein